MADSLPTPDADRIAADRLFAERVTRYLDDALPADELVLLNQQLAADASRRERFVDLCLVESMVAEEFSQQAGDARGVASPGETSTWSGLAALSVGAADADDWRPAPLDRQRRRMRMPWVGGGLAVAASVLIVAGVAWHFGDRPAAGTPSIVVAPRPKFTPATLPAAVVAVAGLGDTRDAVWDGPAVAAGGRLLPGTALALARGVATVKFDHGATVLIEGPARLTIDSPAALTLASGRVFATAAGGFVVNTPDAVVTDLGTEFGVATKPAGGTRFEVFRGVVRVDGHGPAGGVPLTLAAGEAADVATLPTRDAGGALPQHFVRSLATPSAEPVTLDVVDLVAGGDGRGHRRGRGIDVLSGRASTTQVSSYVSKHGYQRADRVPAVDGVFVPDQAAAPTTLDSAGHTFTFPATDAHGFALLWAGGPVPSLPGYPARPTVVGGTDYATAGHGLLAFDSNKGVTFDLNALRRANPLHEPVRFHGGVGNTFVAGRQAPSKVDVWVLVDGRPKFERRGVTLADGRIDIDVPLDPADRFLTLVASDGGDGYGHDWLLWLDPLIDLRPL